MDALLGVSAGDTGTEIFGLSGLTSSARESGSAVSFSSFASGCSSAGGSGSGSSGSVTGSVGGGEEISAFFSASLETQKVTLQIAE